MLPEYTPAPRFDVFSQQWRKQCRRRFDVLSKVVCPPKNRCRNLDVRQENAPAPRSNGAEAKTIAKCTTCEISAFPNFFPEKSQIGQLVGRSGLSNVEPQFFDFFGSRPPLQNGRLLHQKTRCRKVVYLPTNRCRNLEMFLRCAPARCFYILPRIPNGPECLRQKKGKGREIRR